MFRWAALASSAVVGGLDNLSPLETRMEPIAAWEPVAAMFTQIEAGARWPWQALYAKAAFLLKPGGTPGNMADYRVLLLTSVLYRLRARIRVRQLDEWAQSWHLDGAYGSGPGLGAMDASYQLSIRVGEAICENWPFAGGVSGLAQAFDRVLRQLRLPVALAAGSPARLAQAYVRYLAHLKIYNQYGTGLGRPMKRSISIPQGCPLSMRMLAILVRPWLSLSKAMQVVLRSLADDVLFMCVDERSLELGQEIDHVWQAARTILATYQYILAIGGAARASKTWLFAFTTAGRRVLRLVRFPDQLDVPIPVCQQSRDLGAHIDTTRRRNGTTLTQRMDRATEQCRAHSQTPGRTIQRYRLAVGKYIPMALYGCESTPANRTSLQKLSGAILALLMGQKAETANHLRCVTLAFHAYAAGNVVTADPLHHVFVRRVMGLRRAMVRQPDRVVRMQRIYQHYATAQRDGTSLGDSAWVMPMPRVTTKIRSKWTWNTRPYGPVGLLLETCSQRGTARTEDFAIVSHDMPPLLIPLDPIQLLRAQTWRLCAVSDFRVVASNRQAFQGSRFFDKAPSLQLLRRRPQAPEPLQGPVSRGAQIKHDQRVAQCTKAGLALDHNAAMRIYPEHPKADLLRALLAGAIWSPSKLAKAGYATTSKCFFCDEPHADHDHILWRCPCSASERYADPDAATVVQWHRALPRPLREYGWAPA